MGNPKGRMMEWISVNQGLPLQDTFLTFDIHGNVNVFRAVWGDILFHFKENKITHWMPLPEAPKE